MNELEQELREERHLERRRATMQRWQQAFLRADFTKRLGDARRRSDRVRIDSTEMRLLAEEELLLLRQLQLALRRYLGASENECARLRAQLDRIVCGRFSCSD